MARTQYSQALTRVQCFQTKAGRAAGHSIPAIGLEARVDPGQSSRPAGRRVAVPWALAGIHFGTMAAVRPASA